MFCDDHSTRGTTAQAPPAKSPPTRSHPHLWRGEALPPGWIVRRATRAARGGYAPLWACPGPADADAGRQDLLGPALDVSGLAAYERRTLAERAAQPRAEQHEGHAAEEREIRERLPHWTVPGLDVDGHDRAAVARIVDRLVVAAQARDLVLRRSCSSGLDAAGRHLELGPATELLPPDALRRALGLYAALAAEGGLVAQSGAPCARDGTPLFWVEPDDDASPGRPKDAPARLDLSPVNHDPGSRERLFRPLGGRSKDGRRRKVLEPGSPTHGTPLTAALLAPYAPRAEAPRGAEVRRPRLRVHVPTVAGADAGRLERLVAAYAALQVPGANHPLRLGLAGLWQDAGLGDRATYIHVVGHGLGDVEDARAAWDSTADARRTGRRTTGRTWVRAQLGPAALLELAHAHALTSGAAVTDVLAGLGRPVGGRGLEHEGRSLADALAHAEAGALARRIGERAPSCLRFEGQAGCGFCGESVGGRRAVRCGVREICWSCALLWARQRVDWLRDAWPAAGRYDVATSPTYVTWEGARDALAVARRAETAGERAPVLLVPVLDGDQSPGYQLVVVAPAGHPLTGAVGGDLVAGVTRRRALDAVALALLARAVVVQELLQRRRIDDAAAVLIAVRRRVEQRTTHGSVLPWPTSDDLKAKARERACARDESCPCGHCEDAGTRWTYYLAGTDVEVAQSRYAQTPEALAHSYRTLVLLGRVPRPPDAPPCRPLPHPRR